MRPRIMISTNLESGWDSKSVNILFIIPQPRNQLWIHISCSKSVGHCLLNCGCNMQLRIMISTNLESGWDSKSVNILFIIPQPRNQLWIHISCSKSVADTVCWIVDAICSRGSWSQQIWNLAEILNQSIFYLQFLSWEIKYEFIFHVVKVWLTLFVELWMQYVAEDHDCNEFGIRPRFCISRYFIYNFSAE